MTVTCQTLTLSLGDSGGQIKTLTLHSYSTLTTTLTITLTLTQMAKFFLLPWTQLDVDCSACASLYVLFCE